MVNKNRSKSKNTRNGATVNVEDEMEILVVSSPSSNSVPSEEEEEDADEVPVEEVSDNEDEEEEEEELVVEDAEDVDGVEEDQAAEVKRKKTEGSNRKKNKKGYCNGAVHEPSSSLYRFPMQRVSRIIKSEDPGIRITQEAVFAINKASEMFLQLLSMEAYACAFLDRKKFVAYNHLSSVVTKRKRFDFLSDFVPEKLKAEDALKEIPSMDASS